MDTLQIIRQLEERKVKEVKPDRGNPSRTHEYFLGIARAANKIRRVNRES